MYKYKVIRLNLQVKKPEKLAFKNYIIDSRSFGLSE